MKHRKASSDGFYAGLNAFEVSLLAGEKEIELLDRDGKSKGRSLWFMNPAHDFLNANPDDRFDVMPWDDDFIVSKE